ncbi:MMPL family transporter [Streptomyces sp. 6N223]|uniref:MMPL family transporter n=1 Tax=Streptomyces sp. 6N223 TaxID=3457412 RepID=UPI003FD13E58
MTTRGATRQSVYERLAGFAQRRRWTALLLWVALLVGVQIAAEAAGQAYRNDFSLPGTESQDATDLLDEHGSPLAGDTVAIVLHDEAGVRRPEVRRRVDTMLPKVARLPKVAEVDSPYRSQEAISRDGTIGYATVVLTVKAEDMTGSEVQRIYDAATTAQGGGLQVELGGDAARLLAEEESFLAEGVGVLAALVILVVMFGTVIAASLPVITAIFAVGSAVGIMVLLSHILTIADFTPFVMALVGLGVGIDYALLIFSRYRAELAAGHGPGEATRVALDAAGRTVSLSGSIVIVALLGLYALGIGGLQGMALSVALTVLVTMVASLTLLPGLLSVFGHRFQRQVTARAARRDDRGRPPPGAAWRRWGAAVQRRPLAALLVAAAALAAMSLPVLGLRLGFADAGNDQSGTTSRQAYDLLSRGFGPGFNGPLFVVADGGRDGAERAGEAATLVLNRTPDVASATGPIPTRDGQAATVLAFPASSPQAEDTSDLVHRLRDEVLPGLERDTGARYLVGGATAGAEDFASVVSERILLFVAIVVGLSMLLIMTVFRSLLIPLKAALLNLLSIGAALGAMILVFQEGLFGVEAGPVEPWIPVMIFAIIFGLSMDYEIFLVSRIHEEWTRTGDHALAVREGLGHTGSLITAAGAIMIAVFGSFMLSPERVLQEIGFGMAVAIFVDAVVIRCLIVPAAMALMGRAAWWFPHWLGRLLPRVRLERR